MVDLTSSVGDRVTSFPISLGALVDVLSDCVRAMDDDRSVHEVMCRGMASVLQATFVSFVQLNAMSQQCSVVCWPQSDTRVAIRYVTSETWPIAEPPVSRAGAWRWRRTIAFGIMQDLTGAMDYAELQLAACVAEDRLAVFARQDHFQGVDLRLLTVCEKSMAAIDGHLLRHEAAAEVSGTPPKDVIDLPFPGVSVALTRREIEVLALLQDGLKAHTMAGRLGISPRTINKHLGNVYRKLDAHDRLVAVGKAQRLGILPPQ